MFNRRAQSLTVETRMDVADSIHLPDMGEALGVP